MRRPAGEIHVLLWIGLMIVQFVLTKIGAGHSPVDHLIAPVGKTCSGTISSLSSGLSRKRDCDLNDRSDQGCNDKAQRRIVCVWWVRLVIATDDPPVYSVPVRTKKSRSISYTQMERQQHINGLTLINRFSSYFEEAPNILLLAEFPKDAKARLIAVRRSMPLLRNTK